MGKTVREKDRGRTKRTERARKWREWAPMMRCVAEITEKKLKADSGGGSSGVDAMDG